MAVHCFFRLVVHGNPAPSPWCKRFFLLAQQCFGATYEPLFLVRSWCFGCRKTKNRFETRLWLRTSTGTALVEKGEALPIRVLRSRLAVLRLARLARPAVRVPRPPRRCGGLNRGARRWICQEGSRLLRHILNPPMTLRRPLKPRYCPPNRVWLRHHWWAGLIWRLVGLVHACIQWHWCRHTRLIS